jgi:hypothetical protein
MPTKTRLLERADTIPPKPKLVALRVVCEPPGRSSPHTVSSRRIGAEKTLFFDYVRY